MASYLERLVEAGRMTLAEVVAPAPAAQPLVEEEAAFVTTEPPAPPPMSAPAVEPPAQAPPAPAAAPRAEPLARPSAARPVPPPAAVHPAPPVERHGPAPAPADAPPAPMVEASVQPEPAREDHDEQAGDPAPARAATARQPPRPPARTDVPPLSPVPRPSLRDAGIRTVVAVAPPQAPPAADQPAAPPPAHDEERWRALGDRLLAEHPPAPAPVAAQLPVPRELPVAPAEHAAPPRPEVVVDHLEVHVTAPAEPEAPPPHTPAGAWSSRARHFVERM